MTEIPRWPEASLQSFENDTFVTTIHQNPSSQRVQAKKFGVIGAAIGFVAPTNAIGKTG